MLTQWCFFVPVSHSSIRIVRPLIGSYLPPVFKDSTHLILSVFYMQKLYILKRTEWQFLIFIKWKEFTEERLGKNLSSYLDETLLVTTHIIPNYQSGKIVNAHLLEVAFRLASFCQEFTVYARH